MVHALQFVSSAKAVDWETTGNEAIDSYSCIFGKLRNSTQLYVRRPSPFGLSHELTMDEQKLIYLVSNYVDLYDVSSAHYSNHERKQNIWKDIANAMGQPGKYCDR